jgi:hypothetical protein
VHTRVLRRNSEYCMVSAGHSASQEAAKHPGSSKECYTSVLCLLVSHLCDLGGCRCSVRTRVLRRSSEATVSAGHSAIRKQHLPVSSRECYTSVFTCFLVSHLCDLVAAGAVCVLACCRNSEYLHGECWSLSGRKQSLHLGHRGML